MNSDGVWLPPLITLEAYYGDWKSYLEAVYDVFKRDFIYDGAMFRNRIISIKNHPVEQGKEASFWHLISEGNTEEERIPDIRRCERIPWLKPIIQGVDSEKVKSWPSTRHRDQRSGRRLVLSLPDFSYVVILADRRDYVLLITAYPVETEHRRRKLRKEYQSVTKS